MIRKFFIAAVWLIPVSLPAQQLWDLKDCIRYGLQHHRSNTVYENKKLEADAAAKEALSEYLPKVGISATFDDNLKVQESVIPAGIFGDDPIRVAFSQKYNTNGSAQLDQTIFDKSLITGIKAGKFNRQQAELNLEQNQQSIIYNISTAFYQIFIYQEQLSLLESNLATYQKQIDISSLQVDKGITLQKDLDKVRVDYNNATSQIRIAKSNLSLSENQLKYTMGYPIDSILSIDSAGRAAFTHPEQLLVENKVFNPENRTEYQLSAVNAKLLELDEQRLRAGALPKLSAYARYGAVGFGNSLGPAFSDLSPFSAIGLRLNIPLFDFFKRNAQVAQAKYKKLTAAENLKLDQDKYRIEYEEAQTKLQKAAANLETDRGNIQLAKSVFKTTDLQLQKGVTDMTDWINAQNSIKEAQNNYLNSLFSYYQARIDLEKAAGSLFSFYNAL